MSKNQKTYNECQVTELLLYIENTSIIYHRFYTPYINSLLKKISKGIYSTDKAIKGFYSIVHESSKIYSKEFGSGRDYLIMFSPEDKKEISKRLEEYFRNEYITEIEETQAETYSLELAAR